jgi:uroporphyrinogen-III decarboxylase
MIKRIDVDRYADRLEASRRRMAAAGRFEEGDRVPSNVSAAGSYYSWLFGVNIRDYYTDIDTQLHVQTEAIQWRLDNLPDDNTAIGLHLDRGPIGEAVVFGSEIVYPDDTSPVIVRHVDTPEDIESLAIPDPAENPQIAEHFELGQRFVERAKELGIGIPASAGGIGIHPPLSCACAIMEPADVYALMLEDPPLAQRLFERCFEAFCRVKEYCDIRLTGEVQTGSLGLADDNSAFVSDRLYREQVMPWNLQLYERYGGRNRYLHADGPNHHHYETYAELMGIGRMDIGGWSELEPAVEHFKGRVVFSGNLNNIDFYGELDDKLRWKIRNCMRTAGPGGGYILAIGGETYPGTQAETLCQAFEYAQKVGRYPIDLPSREDDPPPPGTVEVYTQ